MTAAIDHAMNEPVLDPVAEPGFEGRSPNQLAWARFKKDRAAVVGAFIVIVYVVIAAFAPLVCKALGIDPYSLDRDALNEYGLPLGRFGGISAEHWLGVEPGTGRDILARLIYGARISLFVGLVSTLLATVIGVSVGLLTGWLRGWVDSWISRLIDLLMTFPSILLIIALNRPLTQRLEAMGVPGGNVSRVTYIILVASLLGWMYTARMVRGQTIALREREFVDAAIASGARSGHIMFRQILPNLWAPIIVIVSISIPSYVAYEAVLSFLGVGLLAPAASWGIMLFDSIKYYRATPTYLFIPGTALMVLVLAFNLLGDGIRDALDPKADRSSLV